MFWNVHLQFYSAALRRLTLDPPLSLSLSCSCKVDLASVILVREIFQEKKYLYRKLPTPLIKKGKGVIFFYQMKLFAWICKRSIDKLPSKRRNVLFPRKNVMFQKKGQIKPLWMDGPLLHPKCSCNLIKICKDIPGILADFALGFITCMLPNLTGDQSSIFLQTLQKYFSSCFRNISPPRAWKSTADTLLHPTINIPA